MQEPIEQNVIFGCEGDLWVMSPTSYRSAPPRTLIIATESKPGQSHGLPVADDPAQNLILLDRAPQADPASRRAARRALLQDILALVALGVAALGVVLLIQWAEWGLR